MRLPVLGLDSCLPSTGSAPVSVAGPGGGILWLLDPEAARAAREHEAVVAYVHERFANFIEPEIDLIH